MNITIEAAWVLSRFSCVRLFVTIWTATHQAPLSMGFSKTRILEWVATPFSRGLTQSRGRTWVSPMEGRFFTV